MKNRKRKKKNKKSKSKCYLLFSIILTITIVRNIIINNTDKKDNTIEVSKILEKNKNEVNQIKQPITNNQ